VDLGPYYGVFVPLKLDIIVIDRTWREAALQPAVALTWPRLPVSRAKKAAGRRGPEEPCAGGQFSSVILPLVGGTRAVSRIATRRNTQRIRAIMRRGSCASTSHPVAGCRCMGQQEHCYERRWGGKVGAAWCRIAIYTKR
jgi:hypothetical protein